MWNWLPGSQGKNPIAGKSKSQGTWLHHSQKQLDLLQVKWRFTRPEHPRSPYCYLPTLTLTAIPSIRKGGWGQLETQLQGKPFLLPGYWKGQNNAQCCHWNNNSDTSGDNKVFSFGWIFSLLNVRLIIIEGCIQHPCAVERMFISKHPWNATEMKRDIASTPLCAPAHLSDLCSDFRIITF